VLFSRMRHPYTEALLRSIPRVENPSHTRLEVIGGRPPDLINPPPGCAFSDRCPYAQDDCRAEAPVLQEGPEPGHRFACFHPLGDNVAAPIIAPAAVRTPVTVAQSQPVDGEDPGG